MKYIFIIAYIFIMQKHSSSQTQLLLTDQLNKQNKLKQMLPNNEKICFSCEIQKFNLANKIQPRIFLLTDVAIYNIERNVGLIKTLFSKIVKMRNSYNIKRRIPISKLSGITMSKEKTVDQFVLHIQDSYDYRYRSAIKIQIIMAIFQIFEKSQKNTKLPFYFPDQLTLGQYVTCKQKLKMKISVKSQQKPVYFQNLKQLKSYDLPVIKFQQVFSYDGKQYSISDFDQLKNQQLKSNFQHFTIKTINHDFDKLLPYFSHIDSQFVSLPHYCYATEGKTHLLRPFMKGGSMDKFLLYKGILTQQNCKFYISQLILALQHYHNHGFLYRSLSLKKIFIRDNGYICIDGLEECIVKKKGDKLLFGVCGSPSYMAPQMILMQGYSFQADVWSLGVCLIQMLLGFNYFLDSTNKDTFQNILRFNIDEFFEGQKALKFPSILRKMLKKNPKQRISLKQLKCSEWLSSVNWQQLEKQKIKPSFIPEMENIKEWYGQFPSILRLKYN